jgi:peptidyl-tRNA hydrolase, PTH1 family
MWLVVGLGNPGAKYERNRHNIGFLAVDALAGKLGACAWARKFGGEICEGRGARDEGRVYFLKPQTFMNLSGESVAAAARFYKIVPANIIVIHDELDLPPGKLRVKQGGGDGGHNGIRSIDAHLASKDYWRVRIGIGRPDDRDRVADYVLSNISREEVPLQEEVIAGVAEYFPLLLANDASGFMNKVAHRLGPTRVS